MDSPHFSGAHGTLSLLTEIDLQTETINRTIRLEASTDGRSVLLVAVDARKLGTQREWRGGPVRSDSFFDF
jgi:polyisoprenoid-binding protein YceI